MAWFIAVNHGGAVDTVSAGSTTQSKDIEIQISTTAQGRSGDQLLGLQDLLKALDTIRDYAIQSGKAW